MRDLFYPVQPIGTPDITDADRGFVPPSVACPNCGERRVTALDIDDETVTCCNCGTCYPLAPALSALRCGPCETGFHADCHGCPCCVTALDEARDSGEGRRFMLARERAVNSGAKQVASIGRILPHRRVSAPRGGR